MDDDTVKGLINKTIKNARIKKISKEYDDRPFLVLDMADGSRFIIESKYGKWTGKSEDEYPRYITLREIKTKKDVEK